MNIKIGERNGYGIDIDNRKYVLEAALSQRDLPFDWKMTSLPSFLYDAEPHITKARKIDIEPSEISDSIGSIMDVMKSDNPENISVEKNIDFWNKVIDDFEKNHADKEMIAFYDWEIKDESLLIKYSIIR